MKTENSTFVALDRELMTIEACDNQYREFSNESAAMFVAETQSSLYMISLVVFLALEMLFLIWKEWRVWNKAQPKWDRFMLFWEMFIIVTFFPPLIRSTSVIYKECIETDLPEIFLSGYLVKFI